MKQRLLTGCLLAYGLLILYGSLMPYDFQADASAVRQRFDRAWMYWPVSNQLHTSKSDLFSNVLLYLPLGFLLAARQGGIVIPILAGAVLSAAVETAQLFSPTRIAGINDVVANTAGTLIGAILGVLFGNTLRNPDKSHFHVRWRRRPLHLATMLLLALLTADALYPLMPTLDVSEVWANIKQSSFSLPAALAAHPWHYWLVKRIGVYAAVSVLLAQWFSREEKPGWVRGMLATCLFAAGIEAAKIFISGGAFSAANVAMSACGAMAGLMIGAALHGRMSPQGVLSWSGLLVGAYILYMEWGFFEFQPHAQSASGKMPRGAEWFPLYHYCISGKLNDVRNFISTISLLAAYAFIRRKRDEQIHRESNWSRPMHAALCTGILGLILEAGQFWIPGRTPSITDVTCFALGGALGAWLANHIRYEREVRMMNDE